MSPGTKTLIAAAVVGVMGLGSLAAATIPTRMPVDPEGKALAGAPADAAETSFAVEPPIQELAPTDDRSAPWLASGRSYGTQDYAASAYPAGYEQDYELADEGLYADFDSALGPQTHLSDGQPTQPSTSLDEQAAEASEVAAAVRAAEAQ